MKMTTATLALVLLLSNVWGSEKLTITTTDSVTYSDVTVTRVEPDSITVMGSSGVARIPMNKLPTDLQEKFGYDAEKAAAYAEKKATAQTAAVAAEQKALNAAAAQKEKREWMKSNKVWIEGRVFRKTKDWIIVSTADPTHITSRSSFLGAIGGGGNAAAVKPSKKPKDATPVYGQLIVVNHPMHGGLADNDPVELVAYPWGLTTTPGGQTLKTFSATLP